MCAGILSERNCQVWWQAAQRPYQQQLQAHCSRSCCRRIAATQRSSRRHRRRLTFPLAGAVSTGRQRSRQQTAQQAAPILKQLQVRMQQHTAAAAPSRSLVQMCTGICACRLRVSWKDTCCVCSFESAAVTWVLFYCVCVKWGCVVCFVLLCCVVCVCGEGRGWQLQRLQESCSICRKCPL